MMEVTAVLDALCSAAGAGGLPQAAQAAAALLRPLMEEVTTDAMGNVLGIRRCGRAGAPTVLLEAHIDEIGFIVTGADDAGFVKVAPCGGIDRRTLAGAEVVLWGDKPVAGVFCSTPPHLHKGGDALPEIADMGVDTGLTAEQVRAAIPAGTRGTFRANFRPMTGSLVCSKALDDRAGVAAVLLCLEQLRDTALPVDVAVAFAVQEELGCRGAATAAFSAAPDAAIAVDVSFAFTPDADRAKCGELGKGPMLGWAPSLDWALTDRLDRLARAENIPLQHEVMGGDTGTDADSIASARAGVRTALLSIPLRYMHTPCEIVDVRDVEQTARLMAAFIKEGGAAV